MSNTTRIAALETRFDAIESRLDRMLTALETRQPAKVASKPAKARKAEPKVEAPVRHLVRKNRPAFVKAHPWASGLSTSQIAEAVVSGAQTCEPGWAIGERRTAMVLTPKAERVVAEVEVEAPAKVRKPVGENHASQGPRDALGRITPKSQWDLRESLALTGKFDRHEIDAIVASQA